MKHNKLKLDKCVLFNLEMILTMILAELVTTLQKMSNLQNEHVQLAIPNSGIWNNYHGWTWQSKYKSWFNVALILSFRL